MGDFPTHWCETDDGYTVVSPMSVLDCNQSKCKYLADWAKRATHYEMDHIEANIAQAEEIIRNGQFRLSQWQLAMEAKRRANELGSTDAEH